MSDDSGNELESGENPAPSSAEKAEDTERAPRKAFRAWQSAQQEEGALSKLGKRISGIFAKKTSPPATPVVEESSSSGFELIMPEVEAFGEAPTEAPAESAPRSIDPAFYVPPDLAQEAGIEVVESAELGAESSSDVELPTPDAEKPRRPSLLSRLFGRKPASESLEIEKDESAELQPMQVDEDSLVAAAADDVVSDDPALIETAEALDPPPPLSEEPTTAEMPESRGLFGRLFSKKPKVSRPIPIEHVDEPAIEPTVEEMPALEAHEPHEAIPEEASEEAPSLETPAPPMFDEPPVVEQAPVFASMDDALPAEPEPSTVDLIEAALAEPLVEAEKKPGFFGRLFGRKSKSAPRPSLEIEFHEDRVEAAAHALDDVSGESFAGSTPEQLDPYANVEDALPNDVAADTNADIAADTTADTPAAIDVEEVSTLEVPAITAADLRFAPPPVPETPADSRSTLELQPFDPFAQTTDSRDTVETTPDSRSTLELQRHEPRSTEELELEAELGLTRRDAGDALELDEKTDEFAIPSVDTEATTGELLEPEGTQTAKLTWWMRLLGRKPKSGEALVGLGGATVVEGNPNFLFSKFKAFYGEIIRFKHQKTEFAAGFSTQMLTDFNADLSPDAAAAAQCQQLATMLELQAAEAQWMGGEAKDRYPDAQYAMACLADELFTHMEWDGQTAWRNHLLEVRLFKSHAADVEVYKRIDKLLKDSPNSHVARDLARVYLLVLAAGFQGKYRPFGLPRAIAQYRQRLYEYIHQGDSLMLYAPDRKIFPDAASRTLEGHAVGRFSQLQRWAAILVFLALGYTVLAHYAWNRVSADLKDVTERIRAASSTTGAATSPTSSNSTAANGGAR